RTVSSSTPFSSAVASASSIFSSGRTPRRTRISPTKEDSMRSLTSRGLGGRGGLGGLALRLDHHVAFDRLFAAASAAASAASTAAVAPDRSGGDVFADDLGRGRREEGRLLVHVDQLADDLRDRAAGAAVVDRGPVV